MKKFMLALFIAFGSSAHAQDGGSVPVPPPTKTPQLIVKGPDTFIDFQDGRVAGLFQVIGKVQRSEIGLRQIENTCDYQQALSQCHLDVGLASLAVSLRWVQHPQTDKVGQIAKRVEIQNSNRVLVPLEDDFSILFWYDTLKDATYRGKIEPDKLICDNFNWAKDLIDEKSTQIKIDSWSSESMTETQETGVNENSTRASVYDVNLKKINKNSLEFMTFGKSKEVFFAPPHISTQVSTITFQNKKNNSCVVSFEASTEKIVKLFGEINFRNKDATTLNPIRSKRLLMNSSIKFFIERALDPQSQMEFE